VQVLTVVLNTVWLLC